MTRTGRTTERQIGPLLLEIGALAQQHARRLVDRDTAEDIAQDVVVTCLERIRAGTWDVRPDGIDAYVRCVVGRRVIDVVRRRKRRREREAEHSRELEEGVHAWMDPELALERDELEAYHERAMAEMPAACRRAYRLVRERHASRAEAAAKLGVTVGAIGMRLARAQRELEEGLKRRGFEGRRGRRKKGVGEGR